VQKPNSHFREAVWNVIAMLLIKVVLPILITVFAVRYCERVDYFRQLEKHEGNRSNVR
jgi:hypothetical protein